MEFSLCERSLSGMIQKQKPPHTMQQKHSHVVPNHETLLQMNNHITAVEQILSKLHGQQPDLSHVPEHWYMPH